MMAIQTSTITHHIMFKYCTLLKTKNKTKAKPKTNLDLDKFKLEEVCTGRAYKHSWEELGIWLHLKVNTAQSPTSQIGYNNAPK